MGESAAAARQDSRRFVDLNAMRYSRGHPRDYDQWRQLGLEGWGFADVLPYFRRSERNYRGENKYHGGAGELNVRLGNVPVASL